MELRIIGWGTLALIVLVVSVIWLAIKHGRQQKAMEYERESQEAMQRVLKNTDDINKRVSDMTDEELDSHI